MKIRLQKFIKYFKLNFIQEELRKIGANFITTGIVGIFINHFVGTKLSTMFIAAFSIAVIGIFLLAFGSFDFKR